MPLTSPGMFYTLDGMRKVRKSFVTHSGIIERADGPAALARAIGQDPNTVKAWKRNDSIPAPHWQAIADKGVATLQELAEAAAAKRVAVAA